VAGVVPPLRHRRAAVVALSLRQPRTGLAAVLPLRGPQAAVMALSSAAPLLQRLRVVAVGVEPSPRHPRAVAVKEEAAAVAPWATPGQVPIRSLLPRSTKKRVPRERRSRWGKRPSLFRNQAPRLRSPWGAPPSRWIEPPNP
jgi:hypothetical protein